MLPSTNLDDRMLEPLFRFRWGDIDLLWAGWGTGGESEASSEFFRGHSFTRSRFDECRSLGVSACRRMSSSIVVSNWVVGS